ncbi:MAG: hypothetical protein JJE39_05370 [Vicinamibacteria bacterium]|nr:hypothetical protein [Vicinamibacteria bacterium]
MTKTNRKNWGGTTTAAQVSALCLLGLFIIPIAPGLAQRAQAAPQDPGSDGADNVRLVGYHDLQGRQSLQLTARSDAANGNWLYVGHQPNNRSAPTSGDDAGGVNEAQMNPVTGEMEINGTSLIDITDPAHPVLKWHIPGSASANHRSVSVVYDYKHNGTGHDYLVRSADDGTNFRFEVFDITDRATNPKNIKLVSEIKGTPPNSCGPGCGGPFVIRAHKGYWSEDSGYYYTASGEPGFRNTLLHVWDMRNPSEPKFVGRAWLPGMKETEDKALYQGQYVHHPIIDEANNRMYIGFRNASGLMGAWDISDKTKDPKPVWSYDNNPPNRGPHTLTPIVYDQLPNFGKDALPRTYLFMTEEAGGTPDMAPCPVGVRTRAYMFDVTSGTPTQVSQWEVPVGDFCDKGGRFGPHQHAEFVNGRLNRHENRIAWIAYFNAGVRVLDLSNPYNLRELGYYIPKTNAMSHPMAEGQKTAIQINDVTIDHRGLAYATDRVGTGLFIFEYTGPKPQVAGRP